MLVLCVTRRHRRCRRAPKVDAALETGCRSFRACQRSITSILISFVVVVVAVVVVIAAVKMTSRPEVDFFLLTNQKRLRVVFIERLLIHLISVRMYEWAARIAATHHQCLCVCVRARLLHQSTLQSPSVVDANTLLASCCSIAIIIIIIQTTRLVDSRFAR